MTDGTHGPSPVDSLTDEQIRDELDDYRAASPERLDALTAEATNRYFYTKNLLGPYVIEPPEGGFRYDPDPIASPHPPAVRHTHVTSRRPAATS